MSEMGPGSKAGGIKAQEEPDVPRCGEMCTGPERSPRRSRGGSGGCPGRLWNTSPRQVSRCPGQRQTSNAQPLIMILSKMDLSRNVIFSPGQLV